MDREQRNRERDRFLSQSSRDKWGLWIGAVFWLIMPIAVVCAVFGWC